MMATARISIMRVVNVTDDTNPTHAGFIHRVLFVWSAVTAQVANSGQFGLPSMDFAGNSIRPDADGADVAPSDAK